MATSALAAAFIPGYSGHMSGPNGRVTRVVLHATVSACVPGGARANAAYFKSPGSGGLAHYVVDPRDIIACCDEDTSCWHAPPNAGSVGIELCDWQRADEWADAPHTAMLALAAPLVRDVLTRHGLPAVWLSPSQLLAGDAGVTSHANVAQAWHKTDHTDPGPWFPTNDFMGMVAGSAPAPAPDPPQTEEPNVLHLIQGDKTPEWWVTDYISKRHISSPDEAAVVIFNTNKAGGKIEHAPGNLPYSVVQRYVDAIPAA